MRQVVLDTETTGLSPAEGHRIIEIGCVELIDRTLTSNHFHVYLNPDRDIDAEAVSVHGLSHDFLADKPRFHEIADEFMQFIDGAELIIHNATFDVGFINHELRLWQGDSINLESRCTVLDTLQMAKKKHPGQRNSLDALCKRYEVDNSHRDLHGALLDAEILAELYLIMTGGQITLALESTAVGQMTETPDNIRSLLPTGRVRPALPVVRASTHEWALHRAKLERINRASGGQCVWQAEI